MSLDKAHRIFCVLCVFALPFSGRSQTEWRVSAGRTFIGESLGFQRNYEVWLGSLGYAWQLSAPAKNPLLNGIVDVQAGLIPKQKNFPADFDIAVTLTLELAWYLDRSACVFFSAGSGPAFQSTRSTIQAYGFLFSNNFNAGIRFILFDQSLSVSPHVRFRHLSNAKLNSPNTGIDNFIAMITVGYLIEP